MTFNGLSGHVTLNFTITNWLREYYWLASKVFYLFTVESAYISVTSGDVGSGVADRDLQNIWNPQKNCGSFVNATSSES